MTDFPFPSRCLPSSDSNTAKKIVTFTELPTPFHSRPEAEQRFRTLRLKDWFYLIKWRIFFGDKIGSFKDNDGKGRRNVFFSLFCMMDFNKCCAIAMWLEYFVALALGDCRDQLGPAFNRLSFIKFECYVMCRRARFNWQSRKFPLVQFSLYSFLFASNYHNIKFCRLDELIKDTFRFEIPVKRNLRTMTTQNPQSHNEKAKKNVKMVEIFVLKVRSTPLNFIFFQKFFFADEPWRVLFKMSGVRIFHFSL